MKKKLKKLFYLSLLLSGLIIAGCELQEDVIEQRNHQHELKLSQKRFSELLQDKNFTTALSKIPKQRVFITNVLGRTQMEDKYGFTIFDTPINVMESDSLIAYNLLIKRDVVSQGSYVENLVMNIFPQKNRTDAYIIKYVFDGTTEINPKNFFELKKKHIVTPIIFNNEPFDEIAKQNMECIRVQELQCCNDPDGTWGGCHGITAACTNSSSYSWMTVDVVCNTGGGSGGGYDYGGTGGGEPQGPHQGGSSGNTHPVYNNPTPPCTSKCPQLDDDGIYLNENIVNLQNFLIDNHFGLLDVPCNQIPYWQTIAQYQVPQSVKNKIENIDSQTGWFTSAGIQTLNDSNNGAVVNMDFFPITITQMPKKTNGQTYTQKELFDYIRTHINDFFDDLIFTPIVNSSYNLNDDILWNSNNPLGAILSINITGNEGSVVCSNYTAMTGEWYFSTITAPWDGTHPVSGNRSFGYYTDVNGYMVIYTRGVDRLTDGTYMYGPAGVTAEMLQEAIAFNQADSKWSNFQNKIKAFINTGQNTGNNGQSQVNIPIKYRPNWNKVKDVLNGKKSISDLGCN